MKNTVRLYQGFGVETYFFVHSIWEVSISPQVIVESCEVPSDSFEDDWHLKEIFLNKPSQ